MHWATWLAVVALGVAGCVSLDQQERAQFYCDQGGRDFRSANYAAARESFQAALDLRPADEVLYYNLGECYDRLGNVTQAERCYDECLQREADHIAARHALTILLVRTGRRDQAERLVQDWLARAPKASAPYAEYAWLWRQYGDLLQAQAYAQRALELNARDTRGLIELGIIYEALGRPDRSVALYDRVLETEPSNVEVTERLNVLQAQGASHPQPD